MCSGGTRGVVIARHRFVKLNRLFDSFALVLLLTPLLDERFNPNLVGLGLFAKLFLHVEPLHLVNQTLGGIFDVEAIQLRQATLQMILGVFHFSSWQYATPKSPLRMA